MRHCRSRRRPSRRRAEGSTRGSGRPCNASSSRTGTAGSAESSRTEHVVSYDEALRLELVEFHETIVAGCQPRTPGSDALHDIALCAAIVRCAADGRPIEAPTAVD